MHTQNYSTQYTHSAAKQSTTFTEYSLIYIYIQTIYMICFSLVVCLLGILTKTESFVAMQPKYFIFT